MNIPEAWVLEKRENETVLLAQDVSLTEAVDFIQQLAATPNIGYDITCVSGELWGSVYASGPRYYMIENT